MYVRAAARSLYPFTRPGVHSASAKLVLKQSRRLNWLEELNEIVDLLQSPRLAFFREYRVSPFQRCFKTQIVFAVQPGCFDVLALLMNHVTRQE